MVTLSHGILLLQGCLIAFFFLVARQPGGHRFKHDVHKLLWGMEANPEEIWKGAEECAVVWTPGRLHGAEGMTPVLSELNSGFSFTYSTLSARETCSPARWLHS